MDNEHSRNQETLLQILECLNLYIFSQTFLDSISDKIKQPDGTAHCFKTWCGIGEMKNIEEREIVEIDEI